MVLAAAADSLTLFLYAPFGLWTALANGRAELHEMNGDIVRGLVVVMLFVALIW